MLMQKVEMTNPRENSGVTVIMNKGMKHDLVHTILEAALAVGAGMSWWMVGNLILGDVIGLAVDMVRGGRLQG